MPRRDLAAQPPGVAVASVRSLPDAQVPLFAPASTPSTVSEDFEWGLVDGLGGEAKVLAEGLRATADSLEGRPAELSAAGFLTASVYAEAARRNLRYAAASIGLDVKPSVLEGEEELEFLDPLLLEWLS